MTRKLTLQEFTDKRTEDILRATNGLWASRLVCTITLVVICNIICFIVASFIILWNARLPSKALGFI